MEDIEIEHHLRFSIEFLSIKSLPHALSIYFKFSHELLGISRSQVYACQKSLELSFSNEFHSQEFFMTSTGLQSSLTPLKIEAFSRDSSQKDTLLGFFIIDLTQILSAELKRTENSVVRVLDIWLKDSFASLRIALFLEDLGPKTANTLEAPALIQSDWELEAWRKAEESKFLSELKQREADYLKSAAQEWVLKERTREEHNERVIIELTELENKLRGKMLEMTRRETKISSIEEEVKLRIIDLDRQITIKDEELALWKEKLNEVRSGKEAKVLKSQILNTREEIKKVEEEIVKFRKMADSQELKDLRVQLTRKRDENEELVRRWEIAKKGKDDIEAVLFKLKGDLSKTLRVHDCERRVRQGQEREELVKRRTELETLRYQHSECLQLKEIKEKMVSFRSIIK